MKSQWECTPPFWLASKVASKGDNQMDFMPDKPKILMATVYVKSQSGRSLLHERKASLIDPRSYLPSTETMDKVVAELQQLGFNIEASGVTLSISGPPELFERTFGVQISLEERVVQDSRGGKPRTLYIFRSSQSIMNTQELQDYIDGIVISTPGFPLNDHDFL